MKAKLIKLAQLECPYCDEKCNSQGGLTLHMKAKHRTEYDQLVAAQDEEDGN